VDAVGIDREDLVVHVHQGRDLGAYTNHDFGAAGNGQPPSGA
jgi:hypothetical protein